MLSHTKVIPIRGNGRAEKTAMRQAPMSRLKRLLERQFSLKNLSSAEQSPPRDNSEDFDPSSVVLRRMVVDYVEGPDVEPQQCVGRNLCNCFCGSGTDSSDEEEEEEDEEFSTNIVIGKIKSLVICAKISEREKDLVTKTTEIIEKDEICMRQKDFRLKILVDELVAFGYDAAICKSRQEKTKKFARFSGVDYEYLDVMLGGERVLIDIDFKSKFEIAHPTKMYKSISQTLPYVFVGQIDHLKKVVVVVTKAIKKSLTKSRLQMPPWRRAEYVLNKWMAPYVRAKQAKGKTSGCVDKEVNE